MGAAKAVYDASTVTGAFDLPGEAQLGPVLAEHGGPATGYGGEVATYDPVVMYREPR